MKTIKNRKLVLSNGMVFEGVGFGSNKEVIAEIESEIKRLKAL